MSDPISDLKHELLAAAERQHGHAAERAGGRRLRRHLGRNRVLMAVATLPIAAAVALLFTAPWSNSPSFLARAEAALTPHGGRILHQKWEVTSTSTAPACTVKRGPNEIWIDQTPPHRYRVLLLNDLPAEPGVGDPRGLACASGAASELGGTLNGPWPLRFVPPNTLSASPVRFAFPLDPVGELREALNEDRAHDEGKTQLDGRTVERIRIDPPSDCPLPSCPREPSYAYVDPETFHPVETRGPGFIALVGGPVVARLHLVARILTYEYLPRTEANLALTDIRAQHPNATGP
jgi:hypothetical protein